MKRLFLATLVLMTALLMALPPTAQANLLLNASFEVGGDMPWAGGDAAHWTRWGPCPVVPEGSAGRESWAARTGTWGYPLRHWMGGPGHVGTGEVYQDVSVTPGGIYIFDIWARRDAGVVVGDYYIRIGWHDAAATFLSEARLNIVPLLSIGPDWGMLTLTGTAPAGSAFARVAYGAITGSHTVHFDDAHFIPEPATMVLLGLGLGFLGLKGLKKKRA